MKIDKNLHKIIKQLVKVSFIEGKLVETQATKSIKILKTLPKEQAIAALTEYLKELKFKQRQHTLYLETVAPLSLAQLEKVKKIVDKKNQITKVVTSINPEILGGFKLKMGDEIWDESIAGKLVQIKQEIVGKSRN